MGRIITLCIILKFTNCLQIYKFSLCLCWTVRQEGEDQISAVKNINYQNKSTQDNIIQDRRTKNTQHATRTHKHNWKLRSIVQDHSFYGTPLKERLLCKHKIKVMSLYKIYVNTQKKTARQAISWDLYRQQSLFLTP